MAYVGTADLIQYLNVQGTTDNALLGSCIVRAQAAVENYTNRVFEAATGTLYYHQYDAMIRGQVLYADRDIYAVQTLVNGNGATIVGTAGNYASGYYLEPRNQGPPYSEIRLGFNNPWVFNVDQPITIAGTLCYSLTPPGDIVQATLRWAAFLYRQRDAQVFTVTADTSLGQMTIPQGVPEDVERLLRRYLATWR